MTIEEAEGAEGGEVAEGTVGIDVAAILSYSLNAMGIGFMASWSKKCDGWMDGWMDGVDGYSLDCNDW